MSIITDLAQDIFDQEFDGDTGVASVSGINSWLEANLGLLNTNLHTEFSGASAELDLEAQAVYKELYLYNFYTKQTRNVLRGVVGNAGSNNSILSLTDGESSVTFLNRNEISKVYRGLASDCLKRANDLIYQYNLHQSDPRQVGGIEGGWYTGTYYQ